MSHVSGRGEQGSATSSISQAAGTDSAPAVVTLQWIDFDMLCRKLADQVRKSGFVPEVIVGIQRGGCVPAVFLAHLLQVQTFCSFGIRTTSTDAVRSTREKPRVTSRTALKCVRGKHVLIVDDVTNSGTTLETAKAEVGRFGASSYKTAVVIWDGDGSSGCAADYVAEYTPGWVTFPWEI